MYYFKEIKYENGTFRLYFIKEPNWEVYSISAEAPVFDQTHESFILDVIDYIACGVKVNHLNIPLFGSLINLLTGVYLLKE